MLVGGLILTLDTSVGRYNKFSLQYGWALDGLRSHDMEYSNFYPQAQAMKCHGKVLTMRNMRGMQLAQPSDDACLQEPWCYATMVYGIIPGPSMWILLEESGVPKKMKRKTQPKKQPRMSGPQERVACQLPCLFIRTKVQWLLDESLDPSWLGHLQVHSKGTFHEDKIIIVYWTKGWSWWVKECTWMSFWSK
jgi:hypothetical protein